MKESEENVVKNIKKKNCLLKRENKNLSNKISKLKSEK